MNAKKFGRNPAKNKVLEVFAEIYRSNDNHSIIS